MDEKTTQATPNRIEDKGPKPKGVIPKNTQSLVIMGVAVLMILIMWLTGGGKKAASNTSPAANPVPPVTPTDTSQLQAFKQNIQAEQQAATKAQSHFAWPATGGSVPGRAGFYSNAQPRTGGTEPEEDQPGPPAQVSYPGEDPTSQPRPNPIKADLARREYLSLYASNVALTYRKGAAAQKLTGLPTPTSDSSAFAAPGAAGQSVAPDADAQALRDAQALAAMGPPAQWGMPSYSQSKGNAIQHSAEGAREASSASISKAENPAVAQPGEINSSTGNKHILFEGTVIPTVLMNRLNGSFSGPVDCLVTEDVYSHDREHVLIPSGTKVLGEAQKVSAFGQERLAVFFHRLIMPDGYSVNLDQFKGLDQEGATALHDKVNNHYVRIFGASLAVGILGGIGETGTSNIFAQSALDRARTGFGESMAESGERILDRFLNIMPTITIREGTRVNVYLSNDLLLPDYDDHAMPPDL
jgi:type IV secretory pathway VirB10-like protein